MCAAIEAHALVLVALDVVFVVAVVAWQSSLPSHVAATIHSMAGGGGTTVRSGHAAMRPCLDSTGRQRDAGGIFVRLADRYTDTAHACDDVRLGRGSHPGSIVWYIRSGIHALRAWATIDDALRKYQSKIFLISDKQIQLFRALICYSPRLGTQLKEQQLVRDRWHGGPRAAAHYLAVIRILV